jgi:hypothetical protein
MSEFPLDPQLAKMMVAAPEFRWNIIDAVCHIEWLRLSAAAVCSPHSMGPQEASLLMHGMCGRNSIISCQ